MLLHCCGNFCLRIGHSGSKVYQSSYIMNVIIYLFSIGIRVELEYMFFTLLYFILFFYISLEVSCVCCRGHYSYKLPRNKKCFLVCLFLQTIP